MSCHLLPLVAKLLVVVLLVAADTSLGRQHFLAEPADKVAMRGERVSASLNANTLYFVFKHLPENYKMKQVTSTVKGYLLSPIKRYTREIMMMQIYLYS